MQNEEEKELERIETLKNLIKDIEKDSRARSVILGYLEGDDAYYELERDKFVVINGTSLNSEKGEEDLTKNIRITKSGCYEFRKTINGKNYRYCSKSKTKVLEYIQKFKRTIKDIVSGKLEESNVKFNEFARKYFETYRRRKVGKRTAEEWESTFKQFDKFFNKQFSKIKPDEFQIFINKLEEEKPITSIKFYNKICAICKKAYALQIIKYDIAEILEAPNAQYGIRRALTYQEQVEFLNEAKKLPEDTYLYLIFCLITSARREEAKRYKPEDLDRKNKTLFVNGTKTLNAPRRIKVTDAFIKLLDKIGKGFQHTADFYSREAKAIFDKMGSPDLTLNCLRHTCATNMVYLKIPVDYRKHILGHSTTVTTDRIYTHIETGVTKKQIEKLYPNLYFTDF